MSLYLGKTGRKLVNYTLKHPKLNTAVSKFGKGLSCLSRGLYKDGLTRLAYKISQQISTGDKVTFLNGKILDKNGKIIIKDDLLKVGKDMGKIETRKSFASPEGMVKFIKGIYLKPDRWGLQISNNFNPKVRSFIKEEIAYINKKLSIVPDNALSLTVEPLTFKNNFFSGHLDTASALFSGLLIGVYAISPASFSDNIVPLLLFLSSSIYIIKGKILTGGKYCPNFMIRSVLNFKHLTVQLKKDAPGFDYGISHEYVHYLEDLGIINNHILSSCLEVIREKELTNKLIYPERRNPFKKGFKNNMSRTIRSSKINYKFEFLGSSPSYKLGYKFAGLAYQLAKKTNDPKDIWKFINIVAQSSTKKDLINNLKESKYKKYFNL